MLINTGNILFSYQQNCHDIIHSIELPNKHNEWLHTYTSTNTLYVPSGRLPVVIQSFFSRVMMRRDVATTEARESPWVRTAQQKSTCLNKQVRCIVSVAQKLPTDLGPDA